MNDTLTACGRVEAGTPAKSERLGLTFLLGTGRCGSTLLYEVLARHPQVGFPTNLDDRLRRVPRAARSLGAAMHRWSSPSFPPKRVRPSEVQAALARDVSPAIVDPFRELVAADVTPWLARRTAAFFRDRAATQGVDHYVHKFTGWSRATFLHEVFPAARFVHIVRDGRAVANSWLQMSWWRGHLGPAGWHWGPLPEAYAREWDREGRCMVHLAGIGWKILMDAYTSARAGVPDDLWLQVRYEDLVTEPHKQLRLILEFLGLPWTPRFEQGLARQGFTAGRVEAFRRDLTPGQVELLNRSLGTHLAELGYAV
ncbi:sulfotransferase family protein [Sphaerisporangium fuscum]|uniref:sulfotransferase family protein n=1 Tax=Sphaerisporangium fuscum TaxID=2835868 RepID=UPI001BDC84FC|nr:sulfotransferase [Sphaerisporangium fuscum]